MNLYDVLILCWLPCLCTEGVPENGGRIKDYYINISEIPGNLSREKIISSHVKITCYFHM